MQHCGDGGACTPGRPRDRAPLQPLFAPVEAETPDGRGEKSGRTAGKGLPGASQGSRLACGASWGLTEAWSHLDTAGLKRSAGGGRSEKWVPRLGHGITVFGQALAGVMWGPAGAVE
ncbi:hypothetical protein NDU88_002667 [Pleurodeles waltl]|uniref:Uncharacterized protein n=1 Tax=Pleurodeles waltl TaxID=8319 RepID=A0AAV7SB59_PLEWA|nr:hypothetical protein NDU88_002667 [Pleurodeles waltl]